MICLGCDKLIAPDYDVCDECVEKLRLRIAEAAVSLEAELRAEIREQTRHEFTLLSMPRRRRRVGAR